MRRRYAGGLSVLMLFGVESASAYCWSSAGRQHAIEPELLQAIAEVESGQLQHAMNYNKDGSRDIGLMQINSLHLPRLSDRGITEQRLLSEPCLSVEVGASVLAGFVAVYGYNWTAVGAYNAGNATDRQAARMRYAHKVWKRYRMLIEKPRAQPQMRERNAESDRAQLKTAEFDQEHSG